MRLQCLIAFILGLTGSLHAGEYDHFKPVYVWTSDISHESENLIARRILNGDLSDERAYWLKQIDCGFLLSNQLDFKLLQVKRLYESLRPFITQLDHDRSFPCYNFGSHQDGERFYLLTQEDGKKLNIFDSPLFFLKFLRCQMAINSMAFNHQSIRPWHTAISGMYNTSSTSYIFYGDEREYFNADRSYIIGLASCRVNREIYMFPPIRKVLFLRTEIIQERGIHTEIKTFYVNLDQSDNREVKTGRRIRLLFRFLSHIDRNSILDFSKAIEELQAPSHNIILEHK